MCHNPTPGRDATSRPLIERFTIPDSTAFDREETTLLVRPVYALETRLGRGVESAPVFDPEFAAYDARS